MKCPKCQADNPETRKFCRECGAKLLLICSQCGSENPPEDKFCSGCGQNLATPRVNSQNLNSAVSGKNREGLREPPFQPNQVGVETEEFFTLPILSRADISRFRGH